MLSSKSYNCRRDKTFIAIFCLCILSYARSKNINLMQMIIKYHIFAQNMRKCCIKVFHQFDFYVSNKIVWQLLWANPTTIFKKLAIQTIKERFFVFYNNINFYMKVWENKIHNKAYQLNYSTAYICFIKEPDFIKSYTTNHNAMNSLKLANFLFVPANK